MRCLRDLKCSIGVLSHAIKDVHIHSSNNYKESMKLYINNIINDYPNNDIDKKHVHLDINFCIVNAFKLVRSWWHTCVP